MANIESTATAPNAHQRYLAGEHKRRVAEKAARKRKHAEKLITRREQQHPGWENRIRTRRQIEQERRIEELQRQLAEEHQHQLDKEHQRQLDEEHQRQLAEERHRQEEAEKQAAFELEREQEAWADENVYVTSPSAKYFYLRTDPRAKRISPKNRVEGTIPQLVASYGERQIAA